MAEPDTSASSLLPYVPRLVVEWLHDHDSSRHRRLTGTLAFVDISGFTALTERLARKGHVGAEEMSDALNATFGHLLAVADRQGADLVKWGGDAILLMFSGAGHEVRACIAAHDMRARLREVGHLRTTAGRIDLKMSVGIHSGDFDYFLVGDPALHRELLVTGPAASETARLEGVAIAGQIVVSAATAAALGEELFGAWVDPQGRLLRRRPAEPAVPPGEVAPARRPAGGVDVAQVLPVAIRDHLLDGPGLPEHRTIAVGFVQFSGTDRLLEEDGPEAAADALDHCIRNVSDAAAAHGVTFFETDINADGGKVMLTAGAPRTAGRDADRLLRTARTILDRQGRLPLRIGVNTGHVFSGDFGPPFRRTYSVKGDAINLAARIMGKAAPGELLATRTAHDHAQTQFETTDAGPFSLKGKSRPVPAVSIGAITAGSRRRARGELALVGREREMAVLRDALDSARSGAGRVVQLLGEPGIGKSRLMHELADSAEGATIHQLVCDEYQAATPYAAFRGLLRDLFGLDQLPDGQTAAGAVLSRVDNVAPKVAEWLPLLGDVLDVDIPETPLTAELDQEFRKARRASVVMDVLRGLLTDTTLVLVDDAQHMDAASADLLDRLAAEAGRRSWLLVVSRRDQPLGWLPADGLESVELRIAPLGADDALRLAVSAAGEQSVPRPTLAALARRAGGNPLFLESLVSHSGPAGSPLDALPESVEEVVAAQIDQLTPTSRSVLRHAAVLGSQVEAAQLVELLPDVAGSLDDQVRGPLADFLVPDSTGAELRFRHGLIREVAYQGLAYRARRRMHEQVGLAMERAHGSARPEVLSFHFLHAGRYDKAWGYARTAGEQARRKYANTEATELLGRAVEAARRLPRGVVPPQEVGLVLESLGDCWFTIGSAEAAADAYRQALRHVRGDIFDAARMVAKQAMVDGRQRRFPQALRRLSRELRAFDGLDGPDAHRARSILQRRYAISRASQGRLEDAIVWGSDAVDAAKRAEDPETLAPAYATLHAIHLATGEDSYRTLGALALQSYVDIDDLSGQAQCTNNLAVEALGDNRWVEAATMFGRAADLYRRIGDTDNEGVAICNHAEVLVDQGRSEAALALLDEALEIARSVSDEELVALVLRQLGRAHSRGGDPESGGALLKESRDLFDRIGAPDEVVLTDVATVEASLLRGDAVAAVHGADALLGVEEATAHESEIRALRGFALLALGRTAEAEADFRAGAPLGRSADDAYGYAVNCLGIATTAGEDAGTWRDRGDTVLRQLGVVSLALADASWTASRR